MLFSKSVMLISDHPEIGRGTLSYHHTGLTKRSNCYCNIQQRWLRGVGGAVANRFYQSFQTELLKLTSFPPGSWGITSLCCHLQWQWHAWKLLPVLQEGCKEPLAVHRTRKGLTVCTFQLSAPTYHIIVQRKKAGRNYSFADRRLHKPLAL